MSEQSEFWAGQFGSDYIARNDSPKLIENNRAFFEMALMAMRHMRPARVIEFGANVGMNIMALKQLEMFRYTEFTAVEVNADACDRLHELGVTVHHADMLDLARPWGGGYDLVISKGVLIHIGPNDLRAAYAALYDASRQFIFMAEYHATERRHVQYRGHDGKLWLADYGSELLDQYPNLTCLETGFAWRRDLVAPQDNLVWHMFERPWLPQLPKAARAQ